MTLLPPGVKVHLAAHSHPAPQRSGRCDPHALIRWSALCSFPIPMMATRCARSSKLPDSSPPLR
jgi:hypothetical protein